MSRAEPCPVPGCIEPKARGHLMCRTCWRSLPMKLRSAVNRTWKAVRHALNGGGNARAAIKDYRQAEAAAITWIIEKENIHVMHD